MGRMLYDHRNDAAENINIADEPQYAEIVDYMRAKLNEVKALTK